MSAIRAELEALQVGDTVILRQHLSAPQLAKVAKLTPTQITVTITRDDGIVYTRRFQKMNGAEVGSSGNWRRTYLHPATLEDVEAVMCERKRLLLIARVSAMRVALLPMDVLEKIVALLDECNA